jgi:hypothetical protein
VNGYSEVPTAYAIGDSHSYAMSGIAVTERYNFLSFTSRVCI